MHKACHPHPLIGQPRPSAPHAYPSIHMKARRPPVTPRILPATKMSDQPAAPEAPWHASFPTPLSTPTFIPRSEILSYLRTSPSSLLLIDLRRHDHAGGTIRGSLNLPAQTLYPSLPTLYRIAKDAGVKMVVFYCGE